MANANTSASGGPLQPSVASPPLEGAALQVFLQNWFAPLTSLDPTLVRPRYQPEPANIPQAGKAWCAFGIVQRSADRFPYVQFEQPTTNVHLQRHEELHMLASFYDLGVTGEADMYASLARDNMAVAQNLEPLLTNGFMLAYVEEMRPAPTLKMTRWLYRMDLPFVLRRQVDRYYAVLPLESAQVQLNTDVGFSEEFDVSLGE